MPDDIPAADGTPRKRAFPGRSLPPQDEWEETEPFVPFRTVSPEEADGPVERIEAEGIPCEFDTTPDGQVRVSVRQCDIAQATEALASPSEEEPDLPDDRWYINNWRCPRCKTAELKPLPLSQRWTPARVACLISAVLFGGLVVPLVAVLVPSLEPDRSGYGGPVMVLVWVAAVGAVVVTVPRTRICAGCGWRSSRHGD